MAKWLIVVGLIILGIGLVLHFAPGLLRWFGHLPGNLHFRGERTQVFMPITSMILVSLILTVILNLWR